MGILTRDQILASPLPEAEKLEVPEWGGDVYVGVMTGSQRDRFETINLKDKSHFRARLAVYTLRDQAGNPLFTEADVPTLGSRSSVVLDRIFDVAVRVNAIGKKDVEDLEKN